MGNYQIITNTNVVANNACTNMQKQRPLLFLKQSTTNTFSRKIRTSLTK